MNYLFFFCLSIGLSAALTPLVKALAVRSGAVVQPRQDRWHKKPTALLGGIAIVGSFVVSYLLGCGLSALTLPILAGGVLVFALGLYDDLRRLSPPIKLIGQIAIAALLISLNVVAHVISYPVIAIPITFLWIVGLTNSFNLLDNMDGLSAGTAAICALSLFAVTRITGGSEQTALAALILAGSSIGFLFYNFNPASIFMGDCGSMFLGMTLSAITITGTLQQATGLLAAVLVPLVILGIPIFDTVFVTLLRRLRGQPISQGGRDHVSHRLVTMGLSERRSVLILYSLSAAAGLVTVWYNQVGVFALGIFVGLFVVGMFYFGVFLGQADIAAAGSGKLPNGAEKPGGLPPSLLPTLQKYIEVFIDLILIVIAYFSAYLLRFEGDISRTQMRHFGQTLPLLVVVKISAFYYFGLYRTIWRHVGVRDFINIVKAVLSSSVIMVIAILMISRFKYYSRAVFVVDALLTILLIGGARFSLRIFKEYLGSLPLAGKKVLIVGAGDGGELALREIRNNAALKYDIVGFVDDDPFKRHRKIHGVSVLGTVEQIEAVSRTARAEEIIIAIPSASQQTMQRIVQLCEQSHLKWESFFPSAKTLH